MQVLLIPVIGILLGLGILMTEIVQQIGMFQKEIKCGPICLERPILLFVTIFKDQTTFY